MNLLTINQLKINLKEGKNYPIIPNLSLTLEEGKTLGVVGESGCGKSILTKAIMQILPEKIETECGQIIFNEQNLLDLTDKQMNEVRGKSISMIFQNQMTSLNPLYRIEQQIFEALNEHQAKLTKQEKIQLIDDVLADVGLNSDVKRKYPHELSGGQRQRIVIAIAIINKPKLLIADEPTTALDVTVQTQILKLFKDIQQKYNMTIIFISHDLGVVKYIADEIAVMYAGRIVEKGTASEVLNEPKHPYTIALMRALPEFVVKGQPLNVIKGFVPSIKEKKENCPFFPRCEKATKKCLQAPLVPYSISDNHYVECLRVKDGQDE